MMMITELQVIPNVEIMFDFRLKFGLVFGHEMSQECFMLIERFEISCVGIIISYDTNVFNFDFVQPNNVFF